MLLWPRSASGAWQAPDALKKLIEARFRPSSKAQGIVVGAFLDWILPRGTGLPLQVNDEIVVDARVRWATLA